MKAIETRYNGYRFRSRLEARWAVFFDAAGQEYKYEIEGYVLDDGSCYLPDFYLEPSNFTFYTPQDGTQLVVTHAWAEVKPSFDAARDDINKIAEFLKGISPHPLLLLIGDPLEFSVWFMSSKKDGRGAMMEKIMPSYNRAGQFFWAVGNEREKVSWDDEEMLNVWIDQCGIDIYKCMLKAREARFEHGETPEI